MLQHMSNIQYFFHDREVVQLKLLTKLSMVDQDSALGKQIYMTKTSLPKWNIIKLHLDTDSNLCSMEERCISSEQNRGYFLCVFTGKCEL